MSILGLDIYLSSVITGLIIGSTYALLAFRWCSSTARLR